MLSDEQQYQLVRDVSTLLSESRSQMQDLRSVREDLAQVKKDVAGINRTVNMWRGALLFILVTGGIVGSFLNTLWDRLFKGVA